MAVMNLSEQKWVTVQQKTFTKWLNTKIKGRDIAVNDLVKDLSDGVGHLPFYPIPFFEYSQACKY